MDRKEYRKILDEYTEEYPVGYYRKFSNFAELITHLRNTVNYTVRYFTDDFAMDAATLGTSYGRNEKTRFVFITRESGTWLFKKSYDDFLNEKENYQSFQSMKFNYGDEFCVFEIWFDALNESYKVERKF